MQSKWPLKKLDDHIIESKETNGSSDLNGTTVLSVTNDKGFEISENKTSADLSKYKIVKENYFAYNPYRINVGSIALSRNGQKGIVSPAYVVFSTSDDLNPVYLFKFLKSDVGLFQIKSRGMGSVRSSLSFGKLQEIEIPFPRLVEQENIIKSIGALEEKVERLIDQHNLLVQMTDYLKKSLILSSETVLEDKICNLCKFIKGSFPTQKTKGGKYPLIVVSGEKKFADSYDIIGPAVCIPLISATGHGHASLKRIFYQDDKFALANIIGALAVKDSSILLTRYLYYYLATQKDDILVPLMKGTANVSLPKDRLLNLVIKIPSITDQNKIIRICEKIDNLQYKVVENDKAFNQLPPSFWQKLLVRNFVERQL